MDKIERCIMQMLWINCSATDWTVYVLEKYTKSTCPQRCWLRAKVVAPVTPTVDVQVATMTYNTVTDVVTLVETNWDVHTVNLWEFWITTNSLPNWNVEILQWWVVKATIYKNASDIIFDNTWTSLSATNVQDAIEELKVIINWLWWGWPVWSNVIWIPYTPVTNQWVWSYAQVVIPLTVPVWYTFDYIEYFTNWEYWLAVFNWSWFDVTSNKSTTVWFENYLYYNEYWFLWSNQWSFITYSTPTSATITLYVLETAAVAGISWIWSIHYK